MKKVNLFLAFTLMIYFISCTSNHSKELEEIMKDNFVYNAGKFLHDTAYFESFTVIQKEANNYEGMLTVKIKRHAYSDFIWEKLPNGNDLHKALKDSIYYDDIRFKADITYDGRNYTYTYILAN